MSDYFFENLKAARMRKGFSQVDLARKLGVAKSTYSMYESGKREPNVQLIKKIAGILEISTDELFGINSAPTSVMFYFDSADYTEVEIKEIRDFAQFIRLKRYHEELQNQKNKAPFRPIGNDSAKGNGEFEF